MIALFFGSFNPIHTGHLIIADAIALEKEIEKVWFVVSPQNPLKAKASLLAESSRYYLANLATEDNPNFFVSNIEFNLPKPSYTIDTLNYLEEKYPDKKFCLVMGGDNLANLKKWKNYEQILQNYKMYIYKRPEADMNDVLKHENIHFLDVPMMGISSTLIRLRIQQKQSIRYLVPENVRIEIEMGGFYKC
jgi:nicotinate-nucleotide adenylyltransferase